MGDPMCQVYGVRLERHSGTLRDSGAESAGYIGGTTVFVSVVCICLSCGEEVGDWGGGAPPVKNIFNFYFWP